MEEAAARFNFELEQLLTEEVVGLHRSRKNEPADLLLARHANDPLVTANVILKLQ